MAPFAPFSQFNSTPFSASPSGSTGLLTPPRGTTTQPVASMGTKAKSPQQNVTPPDYTLKSSQTATPPTPVAPTNYGQSFTDSNGNQGTAKFSSSTGQPLPNPDNVNVGQGSTTGPYTQTQDKGLFGQLVGNSANASQGAYNTGSSNYNAADIGLMGLVNNGSPEVNAANQNVQNITNQNANTQAAIGANPNIAQNVADARGLLATNLNATKLNTAETGLTNALSEQGQKITGETAVLNGGLTGQNQGLNGLSTAASQSSPQGQFGVLTSPISGQPISGGSAGAAAFNGGVIQGQQQAGQSAAQMNVANTAAKGIQGTIQSYLQQNPQLNPNDAAFANNINQWLSGKQLGDPKYQTLANYLNEYISTLAPILGVGGDTTNLKTEIAQSMINSSASGQSISEVLNNIGTLADQKLQNITSAGQGGGQVAGPTPSNFSQGQKAAGGALVWNGTQWVKNQ